jgi:hypothetical protein
MMERRQFLMGFPTAISSGIAWGQGPDQAKLDRISVMSLCFGPLLKGMARPGNPKATLDLMDLAGMVADRWGIHRVEFQQADFPSTEADYLQEFRSRLTKAGSQISQIDLEFANLNISSPDPEILLETMELTKRWIDYAVALGCPRVMVNQGDLAPQVRESAIASLKTINRYAKAKTVFVTLENRPRDVPLDVLVEVIKASETSANPDCGNFPDKESRVAGLAVLYRMTAGSSRVQHVPEKYNLADAIRISKEAGYKGIYTIETVRGNGPDSNAAVQAVLDVVLANI